MEATFLGRGGGPFLGSPRVHGNVVNTVHVSRKLPFRA